MRKVFLGLLLLTAGESFAETLSDRFLNFYVAGDFAAASEVIHCPVSYTQAQINEERAGLQNEIKRLSGEFGVPKGYESTGLYLHTSIVLGCGAPEDHQSLKPIRIESYKVSYANGKRSILRLFYILSNGDPVLGLVGIGEATLRPSSIERQKKLFDELK